MRKIKKEEEEAEGIENEKSEKKTNMEHRKNDIDTCKAVIDFPGNLKFGTFFPGNGYWKISSDNFRQNSPLSSNEHMSDAVC